MGSLELWVLSVIFTPYTLAVTWCVTSKQQNDYSNYITSPFGPSYACTGVGALYFTSAKPTTCYAPSANWNDTVRNTHQSHEIRLNTSEENRVRGIIGGFFEKFSIYDVMNFNQLDIPLCNAANLAISLAGGPDCVAAVGPIPGNFATDPSLRENGTPATSFGQDALRGYKQTAGFASIDFDLIPKVLTATAGIRYFHYDEFEDGSEFYAETSNPLTLNHPNGSCTASPGCGGFGIDLHKTESGHRGRWNLTWHVTPNVMGYYTYSQGFRPGGFNRTASLANGESFPGAVAPYIAGDPATKQYYKPTGYDSDNLTNNEIGMKSEFLDHRIVMNASAYLMNWTNIQLPLLDLPNLGNTTFVVNGPSYQVKGVELQLAARIADGLTVQGASSWNSSSQTNAPCLRSNVVSPGNPTPIGTCITQINGRPYTNPFGALGTSPAFSPAMQFNVRARYDLTIRDYQPFAMVGANHVDSMRNEPASFADGNLPQNDFFTPLLRYEMPGYTTYDAAIGVTKGKWTTQLSGNNLSNCSASLNTSDSNLIKSEVPLRPRVLTLMFAYRF